MTTEPKRYSEAREFTKKPVKVKAIQWDGTNYDAICQFVMHPIPRNVQNAQIFISTLEGEMCADSGDWIVRGVKGEHYPVKPDIFAVTYETEADLRAREAALRDLLRWSITYIESVTDMGKRLNAPCKKAYADAKAALATPPQAPATSDGPKGLWEREPTGGDDA
jgi:hypothetical protein